MSITLSHVFKNATHLEVVPTLRKKEKLIRLRSAPEGRRLILSIGVPAKAWQGAQSIPKSPKFATRGNACSHDCNKHLIIMVIFIIDKYNTLTHKWLILLLNATTCLHLHCGWNLRTVGRMGWKKFAWKHGDELDFASEFHQFNNV